MDDKMRCQQTGATRSYKMGAAVPRGDNSSYNHRLTLASNLPTFRFRSTPFTTATNQNEVLRILSRIGELRGILSRRL